MKELSKTNKQILIEVHTGIFKSIDQIKECCQRYVQVLDEDREAARAFMLQRGMGDELLDLIESVGRGRIHPRLMFMPGPGPERLQRAPLSEQERIINVGVDVVHLVGDEFKVKTKKISELTKSEAEIAVDSSGNTPREIQEERLRRRILTHTFKTPPYMLEGDTLFARENSRIPFAELQRLFLEAEKVHELKKKTIEADIKKRQIVKP